MRPLLLIVALIGSLGLSQASTAQVYKVTDDEGVVFTDRPVPGEGRSVERVEIGPSNRAAPPPDVPAMAPARESEPEAAPEPTVAITSPANEATIAMGPGNFTVSARVTPPLSGGEELVLMMDGQPHGPAQQGTSWFIEGAMRGPHDLVVQRRTASGKSVATSEPVRVYVLRPSIR